MILTLLELHFQIIKHFFFQTSFKMLEDRTIVYYFLQCRITLDGAMLNKIFKMC